MEKFPIGREYHAPPGWSYGKLRHGGAPRIIRAIEEAAGRTAIVVKNALGIIRRA